MKVTKLPSGNYRCRVYVGTDDTGKRLWKSFTGPNRKRVEQDAANFQADRVEMTSGPASFEKAASAFLKSRKPVLSPSTFRIYQSTSKCLQEYFPWLYEMQVYMLSTADLQRIVDALVLRGLSTKTIKNYLGFISVVLDTLGVNIRPPRLPARTRTDLHIPDVETMRKVLKAVEGTDIEIPVLLAAFGPLRRGEICALTLSDIRGNVIHVCKDVVLGPDRKWITKPPKTFTSDRYITMPQRVIDLIQVQGYVTNYHPDHLSYRFQTILRDNGIPPFRFHDLRHFCCSYLHSMNVPDIYIMQRSGHSTSSTLRQIYTHTLQDQSQKETERILNGFKEIEG